MVSSNQGAEPQRRRKSNLLATPLLLFPHPLRASAPLRDANVPHSPSSPPQWMTMSNARPAASVSSVTGMPNLA
jgi:hypothetical protein